jgi:hypothetical protein
LGQDVEIGLGEGAFGHGGGFLLVIVRLGYSPAPQVCGKMGS